MRFPTCFIFKTGPKKAILILSHLAGAIYLLSPEKESTARGISLMSFPDAGLLKVSPATSVFFFVSGPLIINILSHNHIDFAFLIFSPFLCILSFHRNFWLKRFKFPETLYTFSRSVVYDI